MTDQTIESTQITTEKTELESTEASRGGWIYKIQPRKSRQVTARMRWGVVGVLGGVLSGVVWIVI